MAMKKLLGGIPISKFLAFSVILLPKGAQEPIAKIHSLVVHAFASREQMAGTARQVLDELSPRYFTETI
ncbi:MAG: hypothetical protein ACXV7J_16575 [Methylomonas sp.]